MLYGAKLSKIDIRDHRIAGATNLPNEFEITNLPKVKDQGGVNSCVAHASASILEYFDSKYKDTHKLSTNFIYGLQKRLFDREGQGMYLRDACKIIQQYGDPEEPLCKGNTEVPECYPIAEEAFDNTEKRDNANYYKVLSYYRCNNVQDVKQAIYSCGPVLASIQWYDSAELDKDILTFDMDSDYGYHCVMIYGWDETGWKFQNSWGSLWGNKGKAILPYKYKLPEAWGFTDDEVDIDLIVSPKRNKFLDIIYKIVNVILNLFRK